MQNITLNKNLSDFIYNSPSAFHAAANLAEALSKAGYIQLHEMQSWNLTPGKYYVIRNGSSIIAFDIPENSFRGFLITAAHTDSPTFKIKENSAVAAAGMYTMLNVEKYGGMICSSWMDKPLSAAGRIVIKENGKIVSKLVNIDRDMAVIPNVAIHMNRDVNDGMKFNPAVDMLPLIGASGTDFDAAVAQQAGVDTADILSKDLVLYPRTPGRIWGMENEFISSPRLDDLQCAWSCMQGLLGSKAEGNVNVFCAFDNEEVGSGTKQGADSDFLQSVLQRICAADALESPEYSAALANSFMISADNAHAVHPNHPEYADRNDRPQINGGIVLKYNANQKYTTDSVSAAIFTEICRKAGVPVQVFTNRADKPGGSTLGNISSTHVSVSTVDIGLPQLAMHSSWETAGCKDTEYLVKAAEAFYSSDMKITPEGIEI